MDRAFRRWAPDLDRAGLQRLKSHDAPLKIKNYAKVSKKITAQNSALQEARGFIYRLEIEHGRVHLLTRIAADGNLWQQSHLNVFGYTRGSKHAHSTLFDKRLNLILHRQLLSHYGNSGSRIDNEVERFPDSIYQDFATQKTARGGSHGNIEARSGFDGLKVTGFSDAVDELSQIEVIVALTNQRQTLRSIVNRSHQSA